MKNLFPFIFIILVIAGCQSGQQLISIDNHDYKVSNPPNMVKVANNLFADKTEISNLDWMEYVTWIENIHGKDSHIYEAALPDSTVWSGEITEGEDRISTYFSNPAFYDYPVVGITYIQAKKYCKWRTDRVAEMILVQKGILKPHNNSSTFTLSEYEKSSNKVAYVPTFRLPTEQEWEIIAAGGLNTEEYPLGINKNEIKEKYRNYHHHNAIFPKRLSKTGNEKTAHITAPVRTYLPNGYEIYNSVGNVAEMVEEVGVSKGGSYVHSIDDCQIENSIIYAKPEKWLGFRCVAYYEPIQFKG